VPRTVAGFQGHPAYVLKRHLGQRQGLVPGTRLLGLFKGEPYYPRGAVADLRGRVQWLRAGRQVREDQAKVPARVLKPAPRGGGAAGAGGEGEGEGEGEERWGGKELFGEWQTEPWAVPVARDGRVPRSEHGTVECPPLRVCLPVGTVHLPQRGLGPVCKALGVDYAPALVDFERRGGGTFPVIQGVVVCAEHRERVEAAWAAAEERRLAREEEKRVARVLHRWAYLVGSATTRAYVTARHGAFAAPGDGTGGEAGRPPGGEAAAAEQRPEQQQQPGRRQEGGGAEVHGDGVEFEEL